MQLRIILFVMSCAWMSWFNLLSADTTSSASSTNPESSVSSSASATNPESSVSPASSTSPASSVTPVNTTSSVTSTNATSSVSPASSTISVTVANTTSPVTPAHAPHPVNPTSAANATIAQTHMELFDKSRNRHIPVVLYVNPYFVGKQPTSFGKRPVAIINPGYGMSNTEYSFIANSLATRGYLVISIQNNLPSDPPLATTGDLFELRKPTWERGVKNILFVREKLKDSNPGFDFDHLTLIGHSNGADTAVLFATRHPHLVTQLISLDNLYMPFPKASKVHMLTFRSNDQPPANGVLPTASDSQKLSLGIIPLSNARHVDMSDRGPAEVKQEIIVPIMKFLP